MTYTWKLSPSSQFNGIAHEWDKLNVDTFNVPVLESRFVQPAIELFGDGTEIIAICGHGSSIVAMGVFKKDKFGCWSTFQPSQAPVGLWISNPNCTFMELLASLTQALPGPCILASLLQLDSSLIQYEKEYKNIETLDYIETSRISLVGPFEEYWQARSKNTKKGIKKQLNKLKKNELTPKLEVINLAADINSCLAQYGSLESAGWKAKTNTAIHVENTQGKFYGKILDSFCQTNHSIIFRYLLNDEIAAMDLCISNDEDIIILKTTYDEKFADFSPALLMHAAIFEYLFKQSKFKKIEFYGKVMQWHRKWTDEFRKQYHLNYYPWFVVKKVHQWFKP